MRQKKCAARSPLEREASPAGVAAYFLSQDEAEH
jgi:hypothetical protein